MIKSYSSLDTLVVKKAFLVEKILWLLKYCTSSNQLISVRHSKIQLFSDDYLLQIVESFTSSSMIENFLQLFEKFGYISLCSSEIFQDRKLYVYDGKYAKNKFDVLRIKDMVIN